MPSSSKGKTKKTKTNNINKQQRAPSKNLNSRSYGRNCGWAPRASPISSPLGNYRKKHAARTGFLLRVSSQQTLERASESGGRHALHQDRGIIGHGSQSDSLSGERLLPARGGPGRGRGGEEISRLSALFSPNCPRA